MTFFQQMLKKCEQNIEDHEEYESEYSSAAKWLRLAKERYAHCSKLSTHKDDLRARQTIVQELIQEKDSGMGKITSAIEKVRETHIRLWLCLRE